MWCLRISDLALLGVITQLTGIMAIPVPPSSRRSNISFTKESSCNSASLFDCAYGGFNKPIFGRIKSTLESGYLIIFCKVGSKQLL